MSFGINLRRMRKERALTQAEIARAVGVWQTHISNIENGSSAPSLDLALRIAEYLGVTVEELFHENSPAAPVPA